MKDELKRMLDEYRAGNRGLPTYAELAALLELEAVPAGGCAPPVLVPRVDETDGRTDA